MTQQRRLGEILAAMLTLLIFVTGAKTGYAASDLPSTSRCPADVARFGGRRKKAATRLVYTPVY